MKTFAEWLDALRLSEKVVLVEGKNDARALIALGITNVVVLKGKPLFEVVDSLDGDDFVILTDLDAAGKSLYKEVKDLLVRRGKRVDTVFREFLFRETKLSHIEGIVSYFSEEL
ncbi:MAG: toprim domain-containing protein [Nanoarchaeota archaeon]|nr:toprim domain-containing protein [Nanoarchaeota archaeon]